MPRPMSVAHAKISSMPELKVGYARVSTAAQDLTAQENALRALGVPEDRIYVDHGLTGRNRKRPGLAQALAACRAGDTLVVTKLDRLARSITDARDIVAELTEHGTALQIGNSAHDPRDPIGRLLFNILAMIAEFEADLISMRTREGMRVAKEAGKLTGRKPKLTAAQEAMLVRVYDEGGSSIAELMHAFQVGRGTVYRAIDRERVRQAATLVAVVG
jgi:DNA invertase Pin-like site-specific DNA recombinase